MAKKKKETKKHERMEELTEGTKTEFKEHKKTIKGKKSVARNIAKDHLKEGDNYYEELDKMEKKLKKDVPPPAPSVEKPIKKKRKKNRY
jgi:hypothetical protein